MKIFLIAFLILSFSNTVKSQANCNDSSLSASVKGYWTLSGGPVSMDSNFGKSDTRELKIKENVLIVMYGPSYPLYPTHRIYKKHKRSIKKIK